MGGEAEDGERQDATGAEEEKISAWCKEHRHWRVSDQDVGPSRRVRGHDAYYGITGNSSSLSTMRFWVSAFDATGSLAARRAVTCRGIASTFC